MLDLLRSLCTRIERFVSKQVVDKLSPQFYRILKRQRCLVSPTFANAQP